MGKPGYETDADRRARERFERHARAEAGVESPSAIADAIERLADAIGYHGALGGIADRVRRLADPIVVQVQPGEAA